jgi:hypothetical protein
MSIKYKTTARRNLLKPTDPLKYYAIASASGKPDPFSVNMKSTGIGTPKAVTAATFIVTKIISRPGTELKNMLKTLKFEKKA